jgi:subtilisin family serine protease
MESDMNEDLSNESINKQPAGGEKIQPTGGAVSGIEGSDPDAEDFTPLVLERTVIALPLFKEFEEAKEKRNEQKAGEVQSEPVYSVIIDVNLLYNAGREAAKRQVQKLIVEILRSPDFVKKAKDTQGINLLKTRYSEQYVFAVLEEEVIKELVRRDSEVTNGVAQTNPQAIYHIWPDFKIKKLTTKSVSTVKADAARNAFSAFGENIFWAVMDSGIDGDHAHFKAHKNLVLPSDPDPLQHRDFTVLGTDLSIDEDLSKEINLKVGLNEKPLEDEFGHGTHVAGIIAGELENKNGKQVFATTLQRDESSRVIKKEISITSRISGMAPKCKLVSLKVLDKNGQGLASNLIAAVQWIQEINGYGRRIRIQGVNMSVGYEFEPEWFACGQSPLCVEVDRLVKSGVVVVVAAGNTGYGFVQAKGKGTAATAGLDLTINDPGNADLAITVGSTHREMPHVYGVSYFSSKGPTGDGRIKPDLVAPGEKIISCDSKQRRVRFGQDVSSTEVIPAVQQPNGVIEEPQPIKAYYREESGTSMSTPHVSGVIAAFLSVRREFIGKPEAVKEIFLSTATDLKREKYFQGHGLVDLMRAIQSV